VDLVAAQEPDGLGVADIHRVSALDHNAIDSSRIRRTVYEVQQRFRYEYAAPISNLRQRLVVVPPALRGTQRLLSHQLEVSEVRCRKRICIDRFGNIVLVINIPEVEEAVDFDVALVVERLAERGPHLEAATGEELDVYLHPSALTRPDAALRAAAAELARGGATGAEVAGAVSTWVHRHMSYGFDRTGVHTTAGEALATGRGVCQDYAHVMVALCRLLGVPARYVSGHLVGEGGTHAWVEVLVPAAHAAVEVIAWDPTHDRRAGLGYITVAVGRDYRDVAPVSGTYCLPHRGWLSASCRVGVARVEREIAA
jgi:transglutaminase-like putative cysteine protease